MSLRLFLLSAFAVFSSTSNAELMAKEILLTSKDSRACTDKKPCVVTHEKSKLTHEIRFTIGEKNDLAYVDSVKIQGKNRSAPTRTYPTPDCEGVFAEETFDFRAVDLNRDGYMDLRLKAFNSAEQGPVYYVWIFNPATKEFVLSSELYPDFTVKENGDLVTKPDQKLFRIGSDFKIHPK